MLLLVVLMSVMVGGVDAGGVDDGGVGVGYAIGVVDVENGDAIVWITEMLLMLKMEMLFVLMCR